MEAEHSPAERRRAALALWLLVPAPSLGTLSAFAAFPGPVGQAIYAACKLWIALLPLVWLRRVERRPASLSPLPRGRRARALAAGAGLGLLLSAILLGAYAALGAVLIDEERLREIEREVGLSSPARYVAFSAYIILVNSLIEEYVWRWFVHEKCAVLVGPTRAVLLSGLFFTLHHALAFAVQMEPPLAVLATLGVFTGGCLWAWCYRVYGSIWPGYLSHALVDLAVLWIGWRVLFAP
jgi:membrane protease YdiL (CAAX protease family)